jgi:hypothetical protein
MNPVRNLISCSIHLLLWLVSGFFHSKMDPVQVIRNLRWKLVHMQIITHIQWWSGGIAPRILNLDTRWGWVITWGPAVLAPRKQSPIPMRRMLCESQSWFGGCEEQKDPLPLPGTEPQFLVLAASNPLLYGLSYPDYSVSYALSCIMCLRDL